MGPYESMVAVVLAGWLLLAALAQLGPVWGRLNRYLERNDVLGLIPRYHFFAPQPSVHDYHLLTRTRPPGGDFGPWQDVTPFQPTWRWWHLAWNPDRRHAKHLIDLAQSLARADAQCSDPATPLSVPYLLLLRHVTALATPGTQVQFLLARAAAFRPHERPRAVFCSKPHRVEAVA
ncbi:hypothetical protein [Streptomyces cellulosae]|uniref:hypothetical protein n=1 Tax=Streptomyces cellulosae TaxID=1968 RepID=UPI0004C8EC9E|nr:hypothetical protein [Streptomyces cellulosae]